MKNLNLLKKALAYNPDTGIFTWKVRVNGRVPAGQIAGSLDKDGYLVIQFKGLRYKLHRLAFAYMGKPVPKLVDHKNRIKSDNRWKNLRPISSSGNALNSEYSAPNATGFAGVQKSRNKFRADIKLAGKKINLGTFDTAEKAAIAYSKAKKNLHGKAMGA
ncbi:hypothetical protein A8B82_15175 [Sulfitobacter sp. EhC04]|uniref:HNH endonuclease n=1 Tax=Sulfitobacter sp. EhC04 TaxID=1849168 RepID=UPI0007F4C1E7|nr:HNH endonuclease [Sulfitobacter sp. EhC04]OAN76734.1 hypothetical protein A8B82_15175 [Sulfitobacter sp. EhC04]